jgi:hypothetical protein
MNEYAPSLSKLQHEQSLRKPYAGNLHVRFDEEEGAACPPLLTLLPLCDTTSHTMIIPQENYSTSSFNPSAPIAPFLPS